MTETHLDALLDELVATDPHPAWDDVVRRARRSRRRYVAAVAICAALVLAPAAWAIAKGFEGSPAPRSVQRNFHRVNKHMAAAARALARKFPQAEARKAKGILQVRTTDGPLDLWAAPTAGGGTCWFVGWESDLSAPHGPLGSTACAPRTAPGPGQLTWGWERDIPRHQRYSVIDGFVWRDAASVLVRFRDGDVARLPLVEHFFMKAFRNHETVVTVTARDAAGKIVASWRLPGT